MIKEILSVILMMLLSMLALSGFVAVISYIVCKFYIDYQSILMIKEKEQSELKKEENKKKKFEIVEEIIDK